MAPNETGCDERSNEMQTVCIKLQDKKKYEANNDSGVATVEPWRVVESGFIS